MGLNQKFIEFRDICLHFKQILINFQIFIKDIQDSNMKNRSQSMPYRKISGFTLIEVMVVMVILGILAAIVVPKLMSRPDQARIVKVKQDINSIQNALDLYKLDNGFYPSTDQGLQALVTRPTTPPEPHDWKEDGYLQDVPIDPWGEAYQYVNEGGKDKVFSYGPKGKEGNSEISNLNMNAPAGTS